MGEVSLNWKWSHGKISGFLLSWHGMTPVQKKISHYVSNKRYTPLYYLNAKIVNPYIYKFMEN